MASDFSSPQRQSLVGVLVMFADTFQKAARALWPILIIWILKIDHFNKLYIWLGAAAVFVAIAVIAYLQYLNFSFWLDEATEEFIINKGVLNKSRIAIPLDKIQQVNINQSVIQKIIGVHALEVDTAGSGKKEVSIRAIRHELALSLKARLMESGMKSPVNDETAGNASAKKHPFIQISLESLFKTGITSNYARSFALLLAFVVTIFQYIEDFINYAGIDNDPLDEYLNPELLLRFITGIIMGIIIITLIINLVRTIVKYFDFTITKQRDSLLLSYGLINKKNTIIRPNKVQIVTIGHNFFQKKFNILDLKIRQASSKEADDEKNKSAIEIPGCSRTEKDKLLEFLLGQVPEKGIMLKPNIRKLVMGVVKFLILPIVIFLTMIYFAQENISEYGVFIPVYVLFVGLLLYFGFRNNRLFVGKDFIIKQSGAWDIDTDYIAPHKIQAVSVTQYFWHKSPDIGLVTLYTAGGTMSFGLANYTRLKQHINQWLYQVETSNQNWM